MNDKFTPDVEYTFKAMDGLSTVMMDYNYKSGELTSLARLINALIGTAYYSADFWEEHPDAKSSYEKFGKALTLVSGDDWQSYNGLIRDAEGAYAERIKALTDAYVKDPDPMVGKGVDLYYGLAGPVQVLIALNTVWDSLYYMKDKKVPADFSSNADGLLAALYRTPVFNQTFFNVNQILQELTSEQFAHMKYMYEKESYVINWTEWKWPFGVQFNLRSIESFRTS